MMKDKAIENLFSAAKPTFDDKERFMHTLITRLDAVEYIKQHEEKTLRHYRYAMIAALVMGIICGASMTVYVISTPMEVPLISLNATNGSWLALQQNSRTIAMALLLAVISWSTLGIISNIIDIYNLKNRVKIG